MEQKTAILMGFTEQEVKEIHSALCYFNEHEYIDWEDEYDATENVMKNLIQRFKDAICKIQND